MPGCRLHLQDNQPTTATMEGNHEADDDLDSFFLDPMPAAIPSNHLENDAERIPTNADQPQSQTNTNRTSNNDITNDDCPTRPPPPLLFSTQTQRDTGLCNVRRSQCLDDLRKCYTSSNNVQGTSNYAGYSHRVQQPMNANVKSYRRHLENTKKFIKIEKFLSP